MNVFKKQSGLFPASFSFFRLFNTADCKQMFNINFSNVWILTADLWHWKQPLYQLSHNHCPSERKFFWTKISFAKVFENQWNVASYLSDCAPTYLRLRMPVTLINLRRIHKRGNQPDFKKRYLQTRFTGSEKQLLNEHKTSTSRGPKL